MNLPTEYPRERLSINEEDGQVILTYVPFHDQPEHEHIHLTHAAVRALEAWLTLFLYQKQND